MKLNSIFTFTISAAIVFATCIWFKPDTHRIPGRLVHSVRDSVGVSRLSTYTAVHDAHADDKSPHSQASPVPLKARSTDTTIRNGTMPPIEDENSSAAVNETDVLAAERDSKLAELARQIRENPALVGELIERIWVETDPELTGLLVQAIVENSEVAAKHLPLKDLVEHARNDIPSRRAAALRLLSRASVLTDEVMEPVKELARNESDQEIRISAISTMNSWMMFHKDRGKELATELIAVRDSTQDDSIRGIALQAVAGQDMPLEGELLDAMIASLKEPSPMNRAIAGMGLCRGVTPETQDRVLDELSQAFEREDEMYVKRNFIDHMVRAGKQGSIRFLQRLSTSDPILSKDVFEYIELLETGEQDMAALCRKKIEKDDERGLGIDIPEEEYHDRRHY